MLHYFFDKNLVTWTSNQHKVVSCSTIKIKYRSITVVLAEIK